MVVGYFNGLGTVRPRTIRPGLFVPRTVRPIAV